MDARARRNSYNVKPMHASQFTRSVLAGWLAYVAFVIYGSLVPLDYQPQPFDQAWATFKQLPMLQIGVEGRADWVANGVLYVPVGFLTISLFAVPRSLLPKALMTVGALVFCAALALAVEFSQLYFPPRTVSRNDVIAEIIGSILGIGLAIYWAQWFRELLATLRGRIPQLLGYGLQAYAVCYLAFSFFPFDFLLSDAELAEKLASDTLGWFLSEQSMNRGIVVFAAKLIAEMLAILPLGIMLGRRNLERRHSATRHALLWGIALGLLIEIGQAFMFSGVSQGASLFTRAVGMYGGALAWRERMHLHNLPGNPLLKRLLLPAGMLYLLALVAVNGWFDHSWHGLKMAAETFNETRLLPFYYHYFTTEQAALLSLASVALMYAPVGALAWICWWSPGMASWTSAIAATGIELSKLFLTGMHPDPTNLLIGALAAWSTTKLLQQLQQRNAAPPPVSLRRMEAAPLQRADTISTKEVAHLPVRAWFALIATLALTAWVMIDFPVAPLLLGILLLCYSTLLWFKPRLLWAAIPAALPLLDLAPWSGRFYLDEFDFVVMVSLLIGFARTRRPPRSKHRDTTRGILTALLVTLFAIGTLRGVWSIQALDANSFTNYYSPFNAIRVAKGALWAFLLWALIPRFSSSRDIRLEFSWGMSLGLAGTVLIVIWERLTFPGLFNFADVYRVTGPFSQMHTGGADIETYLTAALPFALLLLSRTRSLLGILGGALLMIGSSYALMVTFSRVGYAGFAVALLISCLTIWLARRNTSEVANNTDPNAGRSESARLPTRSWLLPLALATITVAVSIPVFSGSFARERMSKIDADLEVRQSHWTDALEMRDPGLATSWFGMGIGRFPETHYWHSSETKAGSYRLERIGEETFLRLGTGYPLYIEQLVDVEPGQNYVLRLKFRSMQSEGRISLALCEKWLLTAGACVGHEIPLEQAGETWHEQQLSLNSGTIGTGHWPTRPPVKLTLFNSSSASLDIDKIQLLTAQGIDLIRNGDFSNRLDHWFFSVDQDLPWHIWSMPVALLFEQGWIGLLAFGALLLLALKRSVQRTARGDGTAGACLASLAGVLVIASLDTVIDTPRFLLLLLLLARLAASRSFRTGLPPSQSISRGQQP